MKKPKPKSKKEPKPIPADKQGEYDEIVDRLMDRGGITGEQADRDARKQLNLDESMRRTLRRLKSKRDQGSLQAAENEARRQAVRQAEKEINRDERQAQERAHDINIMPVEELKREHESIRSHKFNVQKLAMGVAPDLPMGVDDYSHYNLAKVVRSDFKAVAKSAANKTKDSYWAGRILADQPVVAKAELKRNYRDFDIFTTTEEQKKKVKAGIIKDPVKQTIDDLAKDALRKLGMMESLVNLSRRGLI